MRVVAWPRQVGAVSAEWSYAQGISRSQSLLTDRAYVSQRDRERRVARVIVSGRQNGGIGAGYMEVLKRHLRGGAVGVRLWSTPVNHHLRQLAVSTGGGVLTWVAGDLPLSWTRTDGGVPLRWMSEGSYAGTKPAGTLGRIDVSGVPPRELVAAPGDYIAVTRPDTGARAVLMVQAESRAFSTGVARIYTFEEVPFGGVVQFGVRDSAVFVAEQMPRAVQPARGGDWTYDWSFEEVFEDERGGFEEFDPW